MTMACGPHNRPDEDAARFVRAHRLCTAPMLDRTDRHCRVLFRILSPSAFLYSEMVTTGAIIYGDREQHLGFAPQERPLALQLGGSNPAHLAISARAARDYGYDEVNLNCGCPSPRVRSGGFGACLMLDPPLVAEGVAALREGGLPVTVKCRLGVDEQDSYEALCAFVATVAKAGPLLFIVHARKAWLSGLSPKENRERPKLHYDWVYRLRQDFPQLRFVLNGGLTTAAAMEEVLPLVDGVMVGRAFYDQPYLLAECEAALGGGPRLDRQEILLRYLPYVEGHLKAGVPLAPLVRPLLNLFHGIPNARRFRRILSEGMFRPGADLSLLHHALTVLTTLEPVTIV